MSDGEKTQEQLDAERKAAEEQLKGKGGGLILEGEDIPEAFRGKPAKEFIDTLLKTSLDVEKLKKDLSDKDTEIASLRKPPVKKEDELSEEEKEAQREREFLARPTKFMDKHLDERLAPLRQTFFETQSSTVKEMMRGKLKDFTKYEGAIDKYIQNVPAEMRLQPQVWEGAWKLARLDELDAREKEFNVKAGLHVEEGGGGAPQKKQGKVELSDEELLVAKKFGLTPEDYVKYQKNADVEDYT